MSIQIQWGLGLFFFFFQRLAMPRLNKIEQSRDQIEMLFITFHVMSSASHIFIMSFAYRHTKIKQHWTLHVSIYIKPSLEVMLLSAPYIFL